jgi:predicted RNA binding protein YcfA (HicA-like mRNA interferase family)
MQDTARSNAFQPARFKLGVSLCHSRHPGPGEADELTMRQIIADGIKAVFNAGKKPAREVARPAATVAMHPDTAAISRAALEQARGLTPKKVMSGKDVVKLLESHGFTLDRVKGSHHIMVRNGQSIPVPVHGNDDLGKGLLSKILQQAGLK